METQGANASPAVAESKRSVPAGDAAASGATAGSVPATDTAACVAAAGTAGSRGGWWAAWRTRFGLAEVCGTVAAAAGFAAGYLSAGSLLAAAGVATLCEATGFYGCVGAKTAVDARRVTAHLSGLRRLSAGTWHAAKEQLASCAAAESLDFFLIRPGCMAGAAWLARPLPGGIWLGFAAGKIVADVAWYGMEAAARRGVARSLAFGQPAATPSPRLEVSRAVDGFDAPAAAFAEVAVR